MVASVDLWHQRLGNFLVAIKMCYPHFLVNFQYLVIETLIILLCVSHVNWANMFAFPLVPLNPLVLFLLNYFIVISGHHQYKVYLVLSIIS